MELNEYARAMTMDATQDHFSFHEPSFDPERLGVRWQAQHDTALAPETAGVWNHPVLSVEPRLKRRRRCALPAHSKVQRPGS
jgi:hypothetical protein